MKKINDIAIILLFIPVICLARVIDIPHFGLERIVFPEKVEYGQLRIGGGYSPLYMDPDSTRVTIYGNMHMGFLDWLGFDLYIPHYTETRGALLKAGPGDAVCGMTARGELPFVSGLHIGAFAQTSIPTGYRGDHSVFPKYTSGANDFGFGGALGFVQEDAIHITGNFAASLPEDGTSMSYLAGGGVRFYLPWQADLSATYNTDFTANPPHDFHFNLSKTYKIFKINVGVSKDFARHEESFGYNFGFDTIIQLYEKEPNHLPGVDFVDYTDWSKFPVEDTLWKNLLNLQPRYRSLIDKKITIEYTLLDFTNELERRTYVPLVLRKENLLGRYSMSFKALDVEGNLVEDKNIYGLETRDGEMILFDDDSNDYTKYSDYTELQKIKRDALEELFHKLHTETSRIRRGRY